MTAGVGLVVRADGSGVRLVEYDGTGAVVGQGQRITLSEASVMETKSAAAVATVDTSAELASLLAKIRAQLTDRSTLTGTDRDPQAAFVALAEVVGGYSEAAKRRPDLWRAARTAAYLNDQTRGF